MFNEILARVYYLLRQKAGYKQEGFALLLDLQRPVISKYESGKLRPKPATRDKMLDISRCSREDLVEIFCEALSHFSGQRVITQGPGGYRPTTALAKSRMLLDKHDGDLDPALARALHNKMHMYELANLMCDRSRADLSELFRDCQEKIEKGRAAS